MGLKRRLGSIGALKSNLRSLPITVSSEIATRSAPPMTRFAQKSLASGRTAYDLPRPLGEDGRQLSLVKTGATRDATAFVATGRTIRTRKLPRYAKYLIGKYDILPNGPLPAKWRTELTEIASDAISSRVKKLGAK